MPSFTFAATGNSVALAGATPVFVDISADSFCLDPKAVEAAITARTVGIMPVHLYGHPAAMDELTEIAERHGLAIYRGRRAGARGQPARQAGRLVRQRSARSASTRPRT